MFMVLCLLWAFFPSLSHAQLPDPSEQTITVAQMSENLIAPMSVLNVVLIKGSLLFGVIFLLATWQRFIIYRRNPIQVPLSTVLWMLAASLAFIGIPFLVAHAAGYQILSS